MTTPKVRDIFALPDPLPDREVFEPLARGRHALVERIVSTGQATPPGEWYDQERDEWVVLLRGTAALRFEGAPDLVELRPGEALLIPARCRHRVERTSADPPCLWIAVHADLGAGGTDDPR